MKNSKHSTKNEVPEQPLFTGNYIRDNSISEIEKLTEASVSILRTIKKFVKKTLR